MKRLKLLVALVGVLTALFVLAFSARASAAPYVFTGRNATEVYKANLWLSVGSHTLRTQNTSPGGDTGIHASLRRRASR